MAVYQIYQFDGVALPLYNPEATHDAGPSASTLRESLGGTYDVYGTRRRMALRTWCVRCMYMKWRICAR